VRNEVDQILNVMSAIQQSYCLSDAVDVHNLAAIVYVFYKPPNPFGVALSAMMASRGEPLGRQYHLQECSLVQNGTGLDNLIVQHDIEQCTVNLYLAIVINEPEVAKLVQEAIHPWTGSANHLSKRLLAHPRYRTLRNPILIVIGH
jgi:hypothetical protein